MQHGATDDLNPVHTQQMLQENAPWNLNFETRHEPDLYYGQWPGHTYNPSPPDWRSLVIYQRLDLDMFGLITCFSLLS